MATKHMARRKDVPPAARALRTYRAAALLTQQELADRAGCARLTITLAEGGRPLSAPVAVKVAEVLGCPVEVLLTKGDPVTPDGAAEDRPAGGRRDSA